jgi:hypothetical protein
MKLHARLALTAVAIATATSCSSTTEVGATYAALPVVRAYLYAGQPVNDIRLTWTTTLNEADSIAAPINDAVVSLARSGTTWTLSKSPGDSGYYRYTGSDLVVRTGDVFDLTVKVGTSTLTARTIVPASPGQLTLSADSVIVSTPTFTPGRPPDFASGSVRVAWPGTSGALYYVVVENLETTRTAIADSTGPRFGPGRMIFAPTAADTFSLNARQLTYYGRHMVRVYRVNEEYAQLYATRQQDSRDLNEPVTNIHGGLGVFSAFGSDTALFRAVKP